MGLDATKRAGKHDRAELKNKHIKARMLIVTLSKLVAVAKFGVTRVVRGTSAARTQAAW
jgi:hypothetical protein